MRRFACLVWLVVSLVVLPRAALAEGSARDVFDGRDARIKSPPDLVAARAAFDRAATSEDTDVAAAGLYFLGEMDDDALDFAGAATHFEASVTRAPGGRHASRAAARKEQLENHREGNFGPLVRLERLRRAPELSNDSSAIEALGHDADDFPPGLVRVEARLLAAAAYRGRLRRPEAAIPLLWKVARDPYADALSTREAATEIIDSAVDRGDLAAAERAVPELDGALDPRLAAKVRRLARRRVAHEVAFVEIGLFFGLFAVAMARRRGRGVVAATRRILPLAAAFSLFAAGGGGLLATSYETGSAGPFLTLGPTMLGGILLSRAWSSVGSRSVAARATRGALSASSVVAAAFLVLERLSPQVLDGFGL